MFSARQASKKEVITNPLRLDQLGQEKERVKMQVLGMSKDAQDTSGLFNDIFSFNNQIAKGFVYCLQNQMNLAQIFMELVQTFESDKLWEYFSTKSILQSDEKNMKIGETPSHDFFSVQNQTGKDKSLGFVSSKIERMIGDLSSLLGSYQNDASTDTYKGYLSTSPLGSSRTWTQDVKRGSVPLVVNKSKDFNSIIPMKTQPDYSIDDRRASTGNSKLVSGLRASQTAVTEPDADSISAKRFLKSKQATLNKNKSTTMGTNVSPRNPEEIMDRTKYSSFAQEDSKFSHARQALKAPSREVHRNLERERMMSDKFALKPTMGHIPKKDLVEESLHGGDKTVNSSATSHARAQNNETARMFRLGEFEDNSLIMSLNNTKDIPMSEKKAIKDLIKEEREELARNNMKGGDKKNLIDAKWWRAWKEYVNFDCDNDFQSVIIGIYSRPGRIVNKGLLKYEVIKDFGQMSGDLELRDHLLEHHDYEIVSKKVFDMLSKWYGCDFELVRSLKIDPFRKNKLVLDLYPDKGFAEIKSRIAKFKSVSPKDGTGPGNVISSIIHTNLVNYSGRSKHDSKNAY